MSNLLTLMYNSTLLLTWLMASLKVAFIFCAIVMVRICTPRFGLGAVTRLAWGSLFTYFVLFFILYVVGLLWF